LRKQTMALSWPLPVPNTKRYWNGYCPEAAQPNHSRPKSWLTTGGVIL